MSSVTIVLADAATFLRMNQPAMVGATRKVVAVLDTNAFLDVYSCHDVLRDYEALYTNLGQAAAEDPKCVYRRARARESLLLAIYLHQLQGATVTLQDELLKQLEGAAPPRTPEGTPTPFETGEASCGKSARGALSGGRPERAVPTGTGVPSRAIAVGDLGVDNVRNVRLVEVERGSSTGGIRHPDGCIRSHTRPSERRISEILGQACIVWVVYQ